MNGNSEVRNFERFKHLVRFRWFRSKISSVFWNECLSMIKWATKESNLMREVSTHRVHLSDNEHKYHPAEFIRCHAAILGTITICRMFCRPYHLFSKFIIVTSKSYRVFLILNIISFQFQALWEREELKTPLIVANLARPFSLLSQNTENWIMKKPTMTM